MECIEYVYNVYPVEFPQWILKHLTANLVYYMQILSNHLVLIIYAYIDLQYKWFNRSESGKFIYDGSLFKKQCVILFLFTNSCSH